MDQNLDQLDRDWADLKGILQEDIIDKFKEIGPIVYSHQYEFIQYYLGQDVNQQFPIIALRSQTGSGKTLSFQSLIYQSFQNKQNKIFDMKKIKQKRSYNKRDQNDEIRLDEANCQVYLCHPSKILVGLKNRFINISNQEADQLLEKNEQNQARIDTMQLISFILGQTNNQSYQIIFVSASLNLTEIETFIKECIQNNIDNNKKIIPSLQQQISPYTIVHIYKKAIEQPQQIFVDLLKDVFEKFNEAQIMIFFQPKLDSQQKMIGLENVKEIQIKQIEKK